MKIYPYLCDFKKVGELTKKYSNLPDSYIKRTMEQVVYRTPRLPQYLNREMAKKKIEFTLDRPWTFASRLHNPFHKNARVIYVEPIKEWTIFRGDRVEVLVGPDKGKQGIVDQIIQERNWAIVQGLNCYLKENKKADGTISSVWPRERPLRVTDQVSLVDPSDLMPCKVEWRYTEAGERVRVSLRSGRIVPLSKIAEETFDYKTKATYRENDTKDTKSEDISKITFEPSLRTFEMDIMEKMNIKEDRIPGKTYWY